MTKFFSLALGVVLLSGVMSMRAVEVKYIDFSQEPDGFIKDVKSLAEERYSVFLGDRSQLTKFIYGYLYEVAKPESKQENIKEVQKTLGVVAGNLQMINPKYKEKAQFMQKLLGQNSGAAIYTYLSSGQIDVWLSAIAFYAYDSTITIDPVEFIKAINLSDQTMNNLLSIRSDAYKSTIFEIMAREALGKENATALEWLTSLKDQHKAAVVMFKDLATGLEKVTQ